MPSVSVAGNHLTRSIRPKDLTVYHLDCSSSSRSDCFQGSTYLQHLISFEVGVRVKADQLGVCSGGALDAITDGGDLAPITSIIGTGRLRLIGRFRVIKRELGIADSVSNQVAVSFKDPGDGSVTVTVRQPQLVDF